MIRPLVALALIAFPAFPLRGQDITVIVRPAPGPGPAARAPSLSVPAGNQITVVNGNITVTISVDGYPVQPVQPVPPPVPPAPPPVPAEPPGEKGAGADADFAGASRMYLRGIPLGLRQVAGKVGTDTKTLDELKDEIEAARKRANNGLARRLAQRWTGCFDSAGNIVKPQPIIDSLNEAASAMEAGLR